LLGIGDASEDYHEYYRRLLELDQSGARGLAIRHCDENGLEAAFDDIIAPALLLAEEERAGDHISAECQQFIADTSTEIVVELGNRLSRPRNVARIRVLGVTPSGEPHNMDLLFLLELLRQDGAAAIFAGENKSIEDIRGLMRRFGPTVVCISCAKTESMQDALELIRSIKQETPRVRIFADGKAAVEHPMDFLAAGCSQVCASRNEMRRAIRRQGGEPRFGSGSSTPARGTGTLAPAEAASASEESRAQR
jgi:methylmalonyl-CoA mutase cobalamin-binding subunit